MTEAIVFTIPHRLVRLNSYTSINRYSKYKGAKMKKEQTELCTYYIPKKKLNYPVEITYIWTVKSLANDLGNISVGNKFIEDAMVLKGFIPDDNLKWIKKITHKYRKGEHEKVTVIVKRWRDESLYKNLG